MFDFDASKLLIIGVVALIVIGPKDLPRVLRQVGQMVSKIRRMAGEFQGQFMEAMKEADLQDLKNEVNKLKDTASLDVDFNPVKDIKTELTRAVDTTSMSLGTESLNPFRQNPIGVDLPGPAQSPAVTAPTDSVVLELAEPAHHTPATEAGAVHAVEAPRPPEGETKAPSPGRRRVVVPKRRPPGDRVTAAVGPAAGRGRSILPPRRDPRP